MPEAGADRSLEPGQRIPARGSPPIPTPHPPVEEMDRGKASGLWGSSSPSSSLSDEGQNQELVRGLEGPVPCLDHFGFLQQQRGGRLWVQETPDYQDRLQSCPSIPQIPSPPPQAGLSHPWLV
ncbi:unnamed protein product [Arctogadus glacialis]